MNSLLMPRGIPGINVHPLPELPSGAGTWDGERTLLVCDDVRTWLAVGTVAEMTAALERWADQVIAAGTGDSVLAIHPGPVTTAADLLALAEGTRAPYVDVQAEPPVPTPADPVSARFDAVVTEQFAGGSAPSLLTKALGRGDAVAAFERATAPDAHLSAADAAAVRAASIAVLRRLEQALTVIGPREALLWPVPRPAPDESGGTLSMQLAVGVALDVLRAAGERRPLPFPGGAEIDRLERELIGKQRQLDERRASGQEPRR